MSDAENSPVSCSSCCRKGGSDEKDDIQET